MDLPPTKATLAYAERLRGEIKGKIERDLFRYDNYFSDSPRCRMFGHSTGKTTLIKVLLLDYKTARKNRCSPAPGAPIARPSTTCSFRSSATSRWAAGRECVERLDFEAARHAQAHEQLAAASPQCADRGRCR
ncbi:DUF3596 domain-containing protein [Variovorax sp. IB41]|nr:DUF3596 domain-containing protein [Variovorax sp. IB41]